MYPVAHQPSFRKYLYFVHCSRNGQILYGLCPDLSQDPAVPDIQAVRFPPTNPIQHGWPSLAPHLLQGGTIGLPLGLDLALANSFWMYEVVVYSSPTAWTSTGVTFSIPSLESILAAYGG